MDLQYEQTEPHEADGMLDTRSQKISHASTATNGTGKHNADRADAFETIFEAIADPIFIITTANKVRDLNRAARDLLGIPSNSEWHDAPQVRHPLFDLYDLQGRRLAVEEWPQSTIFGGASLQGANAVDVMMRTHDGRTLFLSVTGAPSYTDTGEIGAAVLVCRDVTERRQMEDELRQSEERFRTAFTSTQVGIALADLHFRFLQVNSAYCAITGYSQDELLNTDFIAITHPDDRESNRKLIREMLAGNIPGFVLQKRYRRGDGSFVWVQNSVSSVHDREGRPSSLIAITEDITEQRKWTQRTQETLESLVQERADGLARELTLREVNRQTDEFISIISHELKSPLTTIKGNVQLARRQMNRVLAQANALPKEVADPFDQVVRFLERAERHILVQTRLINDLLDVSRIHSNRLELHIERRDLVPIVREAIEDQRQIAQTRTIELSIEESEALIMIDADRVGQVLNNYLSNALKYSDESEPIMIRLYREGDQVKVAVTDQGPGLSATQREHVWERFYRVPEIEVKSGSGVGLGLGLHICRTIIERQGGSVGVESEPGHGSTFWFALPL
ncbi:MAG: PAS domain S-box protein [Ktedonobacteraceae bacterium]|nr:PAS domain S-box protein [Ktedonobacteraceae bacterium]